MAAVLTGACSLPQTPGAEGYSEWHSHRRRLLSLFVVSSVMCFIMCEGTYCDSIKTVYFYPSRHISAGN